MSNLMSLVQSHYDGMSRAELDFLSVHLNPDVENDVPGRHGQGVRVVREGGKAFLTAVSDQRHSVVGAFEAGDTVIVEGSFPAPGPVRC